MLFSFSKIQKYFVRKLVSVILYFCSSEIFLLYSKYFIDQACLVYHEWSRQTLSLQYQCNIKQTNDENNNNKNINEGIISWSDTGFSKLISQEQYQRQ